MNRPAIEKINLPQRDWRVSEIRSRERLRFTNQLLISFNFKIHNDYHPITFREKNLEQWKFILRRTLKDYQLCQYIDAVIPEPQGEDQKRQWEDARAIVNLIITASLIHDATYETLVNHGWDTEGEDPKVTYETVLRAFPKVPEDVAVPLLHLATRSGVENARKMSLSRRCTARNVTSATEGSAGKISLNWLPKTGDRIRGILKKTAKRQLDQLQLQVRTLDLDMVIFMARNTGQGTLQKTKLFVLMQFGLTKVLILMQKLGKGTSM